MKILSHLQDLSRDLVKESARKEHLDTDRAMEIIECVAGLDINDLMENLAAKTVRATGMRVFVRCWYDRANTYHSIRAVESNGKEFHVGMTYGGGDQFWDTLREAMGMPRGTLDRWQFRQHLGIIYDVVEVKRRADLYDND